MQFSKLLNGVSKVACVVALVLCCHVATAQNAPITVSGQVVDNNGQPVIGAAVIEAGTTNGVVTDMDGNYTIKVSSAASLEVSFIGYSKAVQAVNGQTSLSFTLEDEFTELDEFVVVGYGVQKKSDVTGALTRVDAEALNSRPVSNAFEALQGKAAGVDITSNQRPGEMGDIRIRGNRSLNASNSPLYVVDGVPLSSGGIEALNPRDIESIDILKDASSTAIYGSRGANGVVLITTNRGKEGAMTLDYSGSLTLEKLIDKSPAMSASDYITWRRWAYYNADNENNPRGDQPSLETDKGFFSGDDAAWANIEKGWSGGSWDPSKVTDTDWTEFVTQTGITHEHTLRASGGSENIQGSFSFGYLKNEGTQKGQEYERFNLSMSVDIQAKPWMKMGGSINASHSGQDYGFSRTGQSSSSGPGDLYSAAKAILRYTVPYDEDGDIITMPGGTTTNTYTVIDEWTKSIEERKVYRVLGSIYAQVDFGKILKPLDGLVYKFAFGPDFRHYRRGLFIDASSAVKMGSANQANWNTDRKFSWTLDNMLMYNKKFGGHTLGVTFVQSASKYNSESASMNEKNVFIPTYLWNNMGAIDIYDAEKYGAGMGTGLSENQMSSYLGRINYSFLDKYLLTMSGRYDGASVLAEGNKWAFFPSMALGWRMDQENFMAGMDWVDQFKVRFGVGTTGNSSVGAYGTLGKISEYWIPFSNGTEKIFVTNEPYYSSGSNAMPNKDLGWEKTTQFNYGIDYSFINGRIGGTLDIYTSRTTDLLMNRSVSSLTGYPNIMSNIGETKNFGIEFTVNAIPVKISDFMWSSDLNFAFQKDEIVELAYGKEDDLGNGWFIGESIAVHYGFEADGIWQESDAAEMAKFNENGHKFEAGLTRPKDQNGDYKIDDEDRTIIGNKNPKLTAGWTNTFSWKGLELTVALDGRFGYMISTGGEGQLGMFQQREIDYWTPDNTGAEWQKPIYNQSGGDGYSSLLGYLDASFIKLRNLSLGYNFDKNICDKIGISSAKVYVQGKNLGNVYSSVDFLDLDLGTSYYNRGITFGLQVGF